MSTKHRSWLNAVEVEFSGCTRFPRICPKVGTRAAGTTQGGAEIRAFLHLWTAHSLERIGDRSTKICERVVYLVTGKMEETNVSRYGDSAIVFRETSVGVE